MAVRAQGGRFVFDDRKIDRLKPPKRLGAKSPTVGDLPPGEISQQALYSDEGCKGLSLVVGSGGAKTFRSQFRLYNKWTTRKLGRFGDFVDGVEGRGVEKVTTDWARNQVRLDKLDAEKGIDPAERTKKAVASDMTFKDVVTEYLASVQDQQRSFADTQRILLKFCVPLHWKPLASITKQDIQGLLDHHRVVLGHPRTAQMILMKLKALWKWAFESEYVETFVVAKCKVLHISKQRSAIFSSDDLRAIWKAADGLSEVEADYVRLLVLTASRRKALAWMTRAHLNDDCTIWTVPPELVKQKATARRQRSYRIPLPPLTRSILLRRLGDSSSDFIFGGPDGLPYWPGSKLTRRLKANGAPPHYAGHLVRHTLATWLQDKGHSPFERGLCLTHAESGVTATHYSFGFSGDLKLGLLTKWEDHVQDGPAPWPRSRELGDDPIRWAAAEVAVHVQEAVWV